MSKQFYTPLNMFIGLLIFMGLPCFIFVVFPYVALHQQSGLPFAKYRESRKTHYNAPNEFEFKKYELLCKISYPNYYSKQISRYLKESTTSDCSLFFFNFHSIERDYSQYILKAEGFRRYRLFWEPILTPATDSARLVERNDAYFRAEFGYDIPSKVEFFDSIIRPSCVPWVDTPQYISAYPGCLEAMRKKFLDYRNFQKQLRYEDVDAKGDTVLLLTDYGEICACWADFFNLVRAYYPKAKAHKLYDYYCNPQNNNLVSVCTEKEWMTLDE